MSPQFLSPGAVIRRMLMVATITFTVAGFAFGRDPRWFVAAGACGVLWTVWDIVWGRLLAPLGDWMAHGLVGGVGQAGADLRPTLDDTVRLLESHLASQAARPVQIRAAIRLEEIYRTAYRDPDRARDVIGVVRKRFPDAPELERFEK